MNNILAHHGIKGQKWGVKNGPPYPIREHKNVLLKKGSIAYRVSNIDNETNEGYAFISYKENDHKKYVSHITALQEIFGNEILGFDMTFKVTKDLVSPSKQQAVDSLIKLIDENPKLKKTYSKAASKMHIFKPSGVIEKQLKMTKNEKEVARIYRDISLAAAISSDFREKYFSNLKSQGFNAMMDGGDMDGKGANTESPILVFERNGTLDLIDTKRIIT